MNALHLLAHLNLWLTGELIVCLASAVIICSLSTVKCSYMSGKFQGN